MIRKNSYSTAAAIIFLGFLLLLIPSALAQTAISVWVDDEISDQCIIDTIGPAFNAQSETIKVEFVSQAEQWSVTRTAVAGGGGPDVVITPGPSFAFELAQAGLLLPLTDFVERLGWNDFFVPWALSLGEVNGELFSLPTELETIVLYYNKTLFEDHGWSPCSPQSIDQTKSTQQSKYKKQGFGSPANHLARRS